MGARTLDIAVAGCGPGGLAAALLLHRDGHRVTLFEQFDVPRPIGSGLMLQPTGLAVLDALGLGAQIRELGAPIDRLFGRATPSGRVVLDVRFAALRPDLQGLAIHRGALFQTLFDAVKAEGIALETGRAIAGCANGVARRHLRFDNGSTAGPFDLVVNALGTRSPLAPQTNGDLAYGALWATLDWPEHAPFDIRALEQRYRRASHMVGVLPVGRIPGDGRTKTAFFWSLRARDLADWHSDGLDRWKETAISLWPETASLLEQITDPHQLTFARYAHRTLANPVEAGLVHLGDAWHSASPQLGQGANMALLDAAALADALHHIADISEALHAYRRLRQSHVRLYQALSWMFTPVYQSDSRILPVLRDYLVGPLVKLPPIPQFLAAMVAGLLGWPLRRIQVRSTASTNARMLVSSTAR